MFGTKQLINKEKEESLVVSLGAVSLWVAAMNNVFALDLLKGVLFK